MLILRFGLAHVLFSNFAHMCLRIVPLTDNSKLIIKIPMIMKNQLLNLKMIALMCLMMVLGGANVWAEDLSVDFENELSTYTDWEFSNIISKSSDISAHGGSFCGVTNGTKTAFVQTKNVIATPKSISFYISKASKNTTSSSWLIEISKDKKKWSQVATNSATSMTKGEWVEVSLDLQKYSDVYVKIEYSGSTAKRCIDDVVLISSPSVSKTLTSLTISGKPIKTNYAVGEEFDPTGLVVTGTYDDKSTATITDGITWAMNPKTLSLSDVACSVTATVGGVTSPAYNVTGLTVNEAKLPSTTDATFGPDWDKLFGTSYDGQIPSVKANKLELNGVSNGVKIKVTNGTSTAGFVKTNDFRLYGNYTITITAPKDVLLSEITMTSQTIKNDFKIKENKITSNVGSVKLDGEDLKWIGSSNEIQFKFSDKVSLSTIKVATKAAAAEPTYTKQTLTFIAKDGADYYATFSSDKVTFITSKHVIPYVVTVANGKVDMKSEMFKSEKTTIESAEVDGYYIPANTGILLYSDAENVDYYTVENKTVDAISPVDNMLDPAPKDGGIFAFNEGYKYYKLAYNNYKDKTGLGFYWGANDGGAFYVKGGTAYLKVLAADAAGAKGFAFNGEATGIEGVNANVENAKAIYNLNGQRVASMAKPGLYIVNGKKVVRK